MKRFKLLFLVICLCVQGCTSELPLFKDEEDLKSDEAIVVFNVYITDPNVTEGFFFSGDLKYIYMNSNWYSLNNPLRFSKYNHISANCVTSKYIVSRVQSGTYFLEKFFTEYSYSRGNAYHRISLASPTYTTKTYPLEFTVSPGEVKYLGDIEVQKSLYKGPQMGNQSFLSLFKIHDRFNDAKMFIAQKYPALANKLSRSLIGKTSTQVLVEKQYSPVDSSSVLKEIENAK